MIPVKTLYFKFLILLLLVIHPGKSAGQNDIIRVFEEPDTSEYLPEFYSGALEYNLMIASSRGYDSEVEKLLNRGADIEAETSEGATPLIFAVANNHLTTVKTILLHHPELNKMTLVSETPLLIAVKNNNLEIAEALIRAGADIDLDDRQNATPLHHATLNGNFYLTDLLLYYEADCNRKTIDGTTPLMAAIWAGHADIADLLIQYGANMEARDDGGFTPFLIAAQNGDTLLMNILSREGVNLYEKTNDNYNALDLAIGADSEAAVRLLLERGKDWVSPEKAGINPYRVAAAYGRKDLIKVLEENNIPGKPRHGIEEMAVNATTKFNTRDIFTGLSITFREPLLNGGFVAGSDLKLWYTRVLMKTDENIFYQYMDKSAIVYGGLFKDFTIYNDLRGRELFFSASLMAAYTFGNKLKGTLLTPADKLRIVPGAGISFQKNHLLFHTGVEYMKTPFYKISPVWIRTGVSYNFFLNRVRTQGKVIRWN
jgi:ankyrin repeat protein